VAGVFMKLLRSPRWNTRFSRVTFSVLDPSPQQALLQVFRNAEKLTSIESADSELR
jgi:hypothetical protein